MLVDSHCHINHFCNPASIINETIASSQIRHWIVPATDLDSFDNILLLQKQYPQYISIALGIHPYNTPLLQLSQTIEKLYNCISAHQSQCVAIGEIGLDFFYDRSNQTSQEHLLCAQLELAKYFDLPVILHSRRSHNELIAILKKYKVRGGIVHAFNGSKEEAISYRKLGFYLGIGSLLSYQNARKIQKLLHCLPIQSWVLETDAPYMHPSFVDNKEPNHPKVMQIYAELLAQYTAYSLDEIVDYTTHQVKQALNIASF
jgi:TatD DNase family protein